MGMTVMKTAHASLRFLFAALALLPSLCLAAEDANPVSVVESYVAAYNEHDVEAMMAYCTDDVRWMTVSEAQVSVDADGKAQLRSAMVEHFKSSPATASELLTVEGHGPMVVAVERAMADRTQPEAAFCSASVYRLQDGLIRGVWYFDAYRCAEE